MDGRNGAAPKIIDFARPVRTNEFRLDARLSYGGVHLVHGSLAPHESGLIGAPRRTIVVHDDKPFDMDWRLPGSDRLQSARIKQSDVHIDPGDNPFSSGRSQAGQVESGDASGWKESDINRWVADPAG